MLGATWVMQGLDVIDGAFFSNRAVSVAAGIVTGLCGIALMLGVRMGSHPRSLEPEPRSQLRLLARALLGQKRVGG